MEEIGSCDDECRLPLILSLGFVSGSRSLESSFLADPNIVDVEYLLIDWKSELECLRLKNSEAELFLRVFSILVMLLFGWKRNFGKVCQSQSPCVSTLYSDPTIMFPHFMTIFTFDILALLQLQPTKFMFWIFFII